MARARTFASAADPVSIMAKSTQLWRCNHGLCTIGARSESTHRASFGEMDRRKSNRWVR